VRKCGLVVAFLGLAAAGVWYWSGWRKSDSALSFLRLRVNDLRGRVKKECHSCVGPKQTRVTTRENYSLASISIVSEDKMRR
jgi:hypothetical protein